jgi:hypothetical protein
MIEAQHTKKYIAHTYIFLIEYITYTYFHYKYTLNRVQGRVEVHCEENS